MPMGKGLRQLEETMPIGMGLCPFAGLCPWAESYTQERGSMPVGRGLCPWALNTAILVSA